MHIPTLAFLQNLRAPEIILIFLVVLLLFGAKRLPELFRSFGKSIREFKKATSEIEDDIRTAMDEEPNVPAKPPAGQVAAESENSPTSAPLQAEEISSESISEASDKKD
ncbi:MAG: Sec-independent protein translocase protein TatAd [Opitutia bacterium UBA7350]|nr:MAG: Sec-independent protein translocase protein TatAd [Opitutae bacterium UBA7350]